jgi:hypothetical protein
MEVLREAIHKGATATDGSYPLQQLFGPTQLFTSCDLPKALEKVQYDPDPDFLL